MPVYKIKDYKIINGEKVKKSKEVYNRETCSGKKVWFFKCNYKDINGKTKQYRSKQFLTKEEATNEEAKFRLQTNEITNFDVTIYDLYNAYFFIDDSIINRESSIYTKESRTRLHILPYFLDLKSKKYDSLNTIDEEKIKNWKLWLNQENLSLQTRQSVFNTFSSIMEYAVEKYKLKYNPLKLVSNFQEKNDKVIEDESVRFMTNEEYNIFINEVDNEFKPLFHFLYETGCRKGEMLSLKWENVDFDNDIVKLKTTFSRNKQGKLIITNTKNSKIKYIEISSSLKKELLSLYTKMNKLDGFSNEWFVFGGLKYISYTTLTRKKDTAYQNLKKKGINITEITIHEFRHSSASYMISNNIPVEIIAYRLGDSVDTIRSVYAHLFPDTQKDVKGLFERL